MRPSSPLQAPTKGAGRDTTHYPELRVSGLRDRQMLGRGGRRQDEYDAGTGDCPSRTRMSSRERSSATSLTECSTKSGVDVGSPNAYNHGLPAIDSPCGASRCLPDCHPVVAVPDCLGLKKEPGHSREARR